MKVERSWLGFVGFGFVRASMRAWTGFRRSERVVMLGIFVGLGV